MSTKRKPENHVVTTIRIPRPTLDRLHEIADAEHRTVSQELRRLVEARVREYDGEHSESGAAA